MRSRPTRAIVPASSWPRGGHHPRRGRDLGDATPRSATSAAASSVLANLRVDKLDLLYLHRPDRSRTYAEAIENFATLKQEGLVSEIGISNANVEEIRIALDVLGDGGLAAVQNEFSPKFNHTSKQELDFCGEHGIAFVPWSPLGGGSGAASVGEHFAVLSEVAGRLGVSPQRVAGLGARARRPRDPDPGLLPPREHHGLRRRDVPGLSADDVALISARLL